MALPTIHASPWPKMKCPKCGSTMKHEGDGRHVCPRGCGEWLNSEPDPERPKEEKKAQAHVSQAWPELAAGTTGAMRQAMKAVAAMPLGTADVVGPCRGHGGKGGGSSKGRTKSPARQKFEAWKRKTAPGRFIRSIR